LRTISEQSLKWRRDKVRELTIKGYTQREISMELQIALVQVNKNLKYMRQEAKHNIQHYTDEYLPAEYQYCLDALNMIVKEMWNIKTEDNRELMQSGLHHGVAFLERRWFVIPVAFNKEHKHMLAHCKELMEYHSGNIGIHPRHNKLITSLRTAVENGEGALDKEATLYDDLFNAFRLSLIFWH
jgi:hypothetical protein